MTDPKRCITVYYVTGDPPVNGPPGARRTELAMFFERAHAEAHRTKVLEDHAARARAYVANGTPVPGLGTIEIEAREELVERQDPAHQPLFTKGA